MWTGYGFGAGEAAGSVVSSGLSGDAVDGRGFARDPVVIHGIHAIGGDVHLVQRAVARAEIVDAVDGDAAQRQVFGELCVGDRKLG